MPAQPLMHLLRHAGYRTASAEGVPRNIDVGNPSVMKQCPICFRREKRRKSREVPTVADERLNERVFDRESAHLISGASASTLRSATRSSHSTRQSFQSPPRYADRNKRISSSSRRACVGIAH